MLSSNNKPFFYDVNFMIFLTYLKKKNNKLIFHNILRKILNFLAKPRFLRKKIFIFAKDIPKFREMNLNKANFHEYIVSRFHKNMRNFAKL